MESSKDVIVKIVKKDKDGVTIQANPRAKSVKISWDEFNKMYVYVDKFHVKLTESAAETVDRINECIHYAVENQFLAEHCIEPVTKMAYIAQLGEATTKLQDIAQCSFAEAVAMIRVQYQMAMKALSAPTHRRHPKHVDTPASEVSGPKHSGHSSDVEMSTNAVMNDNPALLALKEKMQA